MIVTLTKRPVTFFSRLVQFFIQPGVKETDNQIGFRTILSSDVPAPGWPESPGFGLALGGSGFAKRQARPKAKRGAWLGPALA